VLVNTASASGDFVPVLSGPNRVLVTATKTGFERNETIFGEFFVDAFASDGADTDKDNRVSVLEAFTYARREVTRRYEDSNRLLTEHALLEKRELEARIAELANLKNQMEQTVYETELETLLVELALKNREIRAREERN
jgi:hypothetical protein